MFLAPHNQTRVRGEIEFTYDHMIPRKQPFFFIKNIVVPPTGR